MIKSYTDHAANERTFLAWLRTGVAIIAFGFLIDRFDLFVITMADAVSIKPEHRAQLEAMSSSLGHGTGLWFILVGLHSSSRRRFDSCGPGRVSWTSKFIGPALSWSSRWPRSWQS